MSTATPFEMPADFRKMTEQGLEQARSAFDRYLQVMRSGSPGMAALGETELMDKMLGYAERNVGSAFDFATRLLGAKDIQDIVRIQTEFVQSQMQVATEQVSGLSDAAMKAVSGASKSRFLPPSIPFGFLNGGSNGSKNPTTGL